jgi:hypothetical protein
METVPTVRFAGRTDAAALPDLPKEIALAMLISPAWLATG